MPDHIELPTTAMTRALLAWIELRRVSDEPPGVRSVGSALGMSKNGAQKLLNELVSRGMMCRVGVDGRSERYDLTDQGQRWARHTRPILQPQPAAKKRKVKRKVKRVAK